MMETMANDRVPSMPLVGRRRELDQLLADAGVTEPGVHDIVLLGGDAGIGKTRLLRELGVRAREAGHRVLAGHCLDLGDSALPYQPFADAFSHLDDAERDLIAERFPALGPLLPWPSPAPGAGVERAELFASVVAGLDSLATERPVLLVLEDVHWADASTRHLIRYVLAQGFRGPVHVVISFRSDDLYRRHPLRQAIAEWVRLAGVRRMELEPLGDHDVVDLVRSRVSGALADVEVSALVQRAAGNAFYVEELLDAGLGEHRAALPETLSDLLLVRLEHLDDSSRRLVRAASVTDGREGFPALAAAAGLTDIELDAALGDAVDHKVLRRTDGDSYVFRHALLGEAVRDDLLPGERRRIHAAFLSALDSTAPAATVARHAFAAGERAVAFEATVRAAEDALRVAGYDEAAGHYENALELIDVAPEGTDEVDLVIEAANALVASGRLMRALELLRDRDRELDVKRSAQSHGRLLVAIGDTAYFASLDSEADAASSEAVQVVADEPTVLRGQAAALRSRVLANVRRDEEAVGWGERALAIGEQIGAENVIADAKATLTRLTMRSGADPEKARIAFREVIADSRASGHVLGELRGLHQLGFVHINAGELDDAGRVFAEGMRRADETGWSWGPYGFDGRFFGALVAYIRSDWDRTLELCKVGPTAPMDARAGLAAIALLVAAARGETEQIEQTLPMRSLWSHDEAAAVHSSAGLIELHGLRGDLAEARRSYDTVAGLHQAMWDDPDFPARIRLAALLVGQYAAAAARLERVEQAQLLEQVPALTTELERAVAATDPFGPEGEAWRLRYHAEVARLRWHCGEDVGSADELAAGWQAAYEAFSVLGEPYEIARSAARWAEVLLSTGHEADAVTLVEQARAIARRLQAEPLLAELERLTPAPAVVALTPREHEVLRHVAEGLSNGEIGTRLFISTKTVSVHVSNILAKLDASSRTEAAAIARRRGLIDG